MVQFQAKESTAFTTNALLTCEEKRGDRQNLGVFYGDNPFQSSFTMLLFNLAFVILTICTIRFLLKPFRQPRIVSEIIGGIIIGPSVLGRYKKFSEQLFPKDAEFIARNIGLMGFMYFLFMAGVKMDVSLITKSERKNWYIAFVGAVLPFFATITVAMANRNSMDTELAKFSSIAAIASNLSVTAFPVMYLILKDLNLLSSEVGRMAMSTAIISDIMGITTIVLFEAAKHWEENVGAALWFMISLIVILGFLATCLRRIMVWIVHRTPQGKHVDQAYVVVILLGVLVMGFLTDMFGMAIGNGPLWLGLVVPDGPPLGATLVARSETIIMEILMPLAFTFIGLGTDVYAMLSAWPSLQPLLYMILTGFISKMVVMLLASLFFQVSFRDSFAFSLAMSLRGQVEVILYSHWIDKKMINVPAFTLLVLLTTAMTAVATPLITTIYNPLTPYMINKRRTIQHNCSDKELGILVCIHDSESIPYLVKLLELSNPTAVSPFYVYVLHLVELVGRSFPVLIDHENQMTGFKYCSQDTDNIHNALEKYEKTKAQFVRFHRFTAFTTKRTMYQDICKLALINQVSLIILPFSIETVDSFGVIWSHGLQSVNMDVLAHSPCSVAIFVDKGHFDKQLVGTHSYQSTINIVMLFLGGADSREALIYADRMLGSPDVYLTVIRFLPDNYQKDNKTEKKIDDGIVTWFWVKNEGSTRVKYTEVVVRNGEETLEAIRTTSEDGYDLWVVGKQGIDPVMLYGLTEWSEHHELGVIGDYVASTDFASKGSVLIVQQQIL